MTDYKEYIYEVYKEQSFSKAARKLFVSQPWLSATVKKVEQELKLTLFDRSTNPISLTEAGRYYISQIERIMQIEQDMKLHFARMRQDMKTTFHIGSSMFFCTYVLSDILEELRETYPEVTISFTEADTNTLFEQLANGKLDILLEAERPENNQLVSVPWASEELILAVPVGNPINKELKESAYTFEEFLHRREKNIKKPPVDLKKFERESFMMLRKGNDSYERGLKLCQNASFEPHISMYLSQMMTAYYLVCEGSGVAFLRSSIPEYVMANDHVIFYTLADELATRTVYLSYHKEPSSPMQNLLIQYMQEHTPESQF